MSTVEQQVKAIVAEQLGVKLEQVTNNASFVDDLGADSLDTVELVMALEEEFETEIPDEDARRPERRLAGHDVCLGDVDDLGDWMPAAMGGLLERSRALYERVDRLDRLLN